MKKAALLLLLSCVSACQAETKPTGDPFERVFAAISSGKIFSTPFHALLRQLDPLCTLNKSSDVDKDGNVACAKETGIEAMDVTGTATPSMTIVTATFAGLERCAYLRQALTRQYGKPRDSSGACSAHWKIKPGKNGRQRTVGFESAKNGARVYFSIAEEQG